MSAAALTFVHLTNVELELLEHRLNVPDCIADALSDDPDENVKALFTWDAAYKDAEALHTRLQRQMGFTVEDLTQLEIAILKDCVEGSTYLNDLDDAVASKEITRGWALSRQKAAKSVEHKFASVGIKTTGFPQR